LAKKSVFVQPLFTNPSDRDFYEFIRLLRAHPYMTWTKKDLLDIDSLSRAEISLILDTAAGLKEISERPIKKVPTLKGKTIVLLFLEASTRTRVSFDIAAKRLSADSISISAASSSIIKGETLIDTAKNIEAMRPDMLVIRHSAAGSPHLLAGRLSCGVVNAGDGMHAHPTQALLDMMSVREVKKQIAGLNIAIIGDIAHSRVARSNITGFTRMGAHVRLAGPPTMIPAGIERMGASVAGTNGVAIRMAVFYLLAGGVRHADSD